MRISCLCLSRFKSCTVHPKTAVIPVDIPRRWEPRTNQSDGLRLLIFPQPLGRALKNQNAAPASAPCFRRRRRSPPLLFESCTVHHKTVVIPVDIPTRWEPQAKQQPTGLIAYSADWRRQSRPVLVLYRPRKNASDQRSEAFCGGAFSTALEPNTSSRVTVLESSVKLKLSTTRSSKT